MRRLLILVGVSMLSLACSSDKKPPTPSEGDRAKGVIGRRVVAVEPGIAGGMVEETAMVSAKVTALDLKTRMVTLQGDDGETATFNAGPEVKNLDQVKVGDTLNATLKQRLTVYVKKPGDQAADDAYAAAVASAPKGSKPGAILGESYQLVATVVGLDTANRTAMLMFADGKSKQFKVRDDVDMGRYALGDVVVIRVDSALALLVKSAP